MSPALRKKLVNLFRKYPTIQLVYFFGSRARGNSGPLSDYDFAVYSNVFDRSTLYDLRISLITALTRLLGTDSVDIVLLNTLDKPEPKYAIIAGGTIIYERSDARVLVEPRIITEYCDFRESLKRNGIIHSV